MIHVVDEKTDKILAVLSEEDFYFDEYEENLKGVEKFKFFMSSLHPKAGFLSSRRKIVIPGEDGEFKEFILQDPLLINNTKEFYTVASYTDLRKQKIIDPIVLEGQTPSTACQYVLDLTLWKLGTVEYAGIRKVEFNDPLYAYEALWEIAKIFELELRFRVEKKGSKIIGRYVDMVKRRGELSGKEVVFGKDIEGIERHETAGELVTALKCYGPVREDGSRLMVVVEDKEAFQKWNDHGRHLWGKYEPETDNSEMTEERLRTLGETELSKRITPQIQYKLSTIALEHIYGLEHEKVRLGDTNRVKDESKNPPIYLDARAIAIRRSIKKRSRKFVEYGDFIEYTREEVMAEWKKLQAEFQRKLAQLILVSITSSAGNIFKNGSGSTVLTVNTFLGGTESDISGTKYTYNWTKRDKDGNVDASFNKTGKSITVTSDDVVESAVFSVEVGMSGTILQKAQITITDVNDGEIGPVGPPGPQGQTLYTWVKYADTEFGEGMSDDPTGKRYMGIAVNQTTPTKSTNAGDYTWAKTEGDQGIPGPAGSDGVTTYTWVKYADDSSGNGMSDSPDGKRYLGLAYNKTSQAESTNKADYSWSPLFDNVKVGVRNLILNSKPISAWPNATLVSDSRFGSICQLSRSLSTELTSASNRITVDPNTTYTFSGWFKRSSNMRSLDIFFLSRESGSTSDYTMAQSKASVIVSTTDWEFIVWTFTTTPTANNGYIRIDNNGSTDGVAANLYFARVKLEKGNVPSDWDRAPEDVDQAISEVLSTADGKNTLFRQSTQPATTGRKIGDLWFDTANGNRMYVWTGSWTLTKLDYQALAVGKLSAISADLGDVTTGNLSGVRIVVSDDIYNTITIDNGIVESKYYTPAGEQRISRLKDGYVEFDYQSDFVSPKSGSVGIEPGGSMGIRGASPVEVKSTGSFVEVKSDTDEVKINGKTVIGLYNSGIKKAEVFNTGIRLIGDNILSTADRTYIAPTLLNGVTNMGGGYRTAGYRKDALGYVRIRAFLQGVADGKHLFTLPAGFRPSEIETFICWTNNSVGSGRITIYPDGRVVATISGNWLALSPPPFMAEI